MDRFRAFFLDPHKIKRTRIGAESAKDASTLTGAVFLSYASQDAEAARRICEALRAAAIEVWFDLSELRGGMHGIARSAIRSVIARLSCPLSPPSSIRFRSRQ